MNSMTGLNLVAVRRQFDRRAPRAADADFLHREVEARMLDRLDPVRISPLRILDAGCGAGAGLSILRERYPEAVVVGADLSPAMVGRASREHAGRLVSADLQALPFANARLDLVWSNLALHWCPDPGAAIAEWSRVLRADGLLMFSAYGVDSFKELRRLGWSTQRFPDMHDVGDALIRTGFLAPVMDMEPLRLTWRDPIKALADLRALGGHALEARSQGLSSRMRKQQWLDALKQGARDAQDPGTLSVTIELIYGHAWCSATSKLEPGTSRVEFVRSGR
jgi:malonyl-CoA O-methyltransferase